MSNGVEAVIERMGAQRQRLRQALGPRRAELVQFALLGLLFLPWYMMLIRPGPTPAFGLVAAPAFLGGWVLLSLGGEPGRRDRAAAALAGVCALIGFAAFAVGAFSRPAAPPEPAEEVWTPPDNAIATEVTPGR